MSEPADSPGDGHLPRVRPGRPALWLLLVPAVLYCAAPLLANRIEPRILGMPLLLAWIVAATVLSPLVIWLAARLDPAYRTGAVEPLPADDYRDAGDTPGDAGGAAADSGRPGSDDSPDNPRHGGGADPNTGAGGPR